VLPVVRPKRSSVFPLRVGDLVSLANRNPAVFANGDARPLIRFVEPWNDARRFGPVASGGFVVVGKRVVRWVLPRREFYRSIILSARWIGIVKAAVIFQPFFVPRAGAVGHWGAFVRFSPDP